MVGSVNSYSSTRKRRRSGQSDASSSIVSEDATLHAGSSLPVDLLSPASSNLSAKKKSRGTVPTPGNLQTLILNIFENVRVITNENGKLLCESLMRMPTRRSNPDYYEVVKEPIDFSMIQKNVKSAKYQTMEQFVHDVNLMVENEKLYHRRSSQEHKDACEFWTYFLSVKHEAEVLESVTRASETASSKQMTGPSNEPSSSKAALSPLTKLSISGSGAPVGHVMQNLSPVESRVIIANVLYNLLSVHEDDRYIAEIFKRVPSAQTYPIYYDVIKNPIDFWMIFKKLKAKQYESLAPFEEDITLLINNAKTFNEPGSQVFKDALTLKKLASSLMYKFQIEKAPADEMLIQKIEAFFEEYLTSSDSESADDSELNTSSETIQARGKPDEDSMVEDEDDEDQGIGVSPFWALWMSVIGPLNKDTGQRICKQFKMLPNKKLYPDYYTEIKRPMSLARIKSKIKKSRYRDLSHCFDDFQLMFNNCMKYNRLDSQIYRDAEFLLDAVTRKKAEIDLKGVDCEEFHSNKKKPGRKPGTKLIPLGPDGNPCPELKTDLDQLRKRLRSYYNLIAKHVEPDGRETAEMFMQLPSKELYPIYYEIITNPIDLKMIDRKIRCNEYNSEEEFMNDVHVMFENARWFNEEGSQIHNDATKLESLVKDKRAANTPLAKKRINFGMTSVRPGYSSNASFSSHSMPPGNPDMHSFGSSGLGPSGSNLDMHQRQPLSPINSSSNLDCPTLVLPSPSLFNQNSNHSVSSMTPGQPNIVSQSHFDVHSPAASNSFSQMSSGSNSASVAVATTVDKIAFSNPMQRKLFTLYEAVKMKRSPRTGRELYEPFYRLPSRNDMPEYYKIISKPIDMQKIYQKMSSNGYEDLNELVEDFVLMFNNACKFNEPGSRIYKDAILLMRVLVEKKNELTQGGSCANENAKVPNVSETVNLLLQRVFLFTVNKEDEDGRCLSDSIYPITWDRSTQGLPPLSLDIISRNLDALVYRRLDHLQEDLFALLYHVRNICSADSEAFEDSLEMQLFFMRKRDDMTKSGEVLFSPALHVGTRQIEKEAEEQRKSQPRPSMPQDFNYIEINKMSLANFQVPENCDPSIPVVVPGRFIFISCNPSAQTDLVRRQILYVKQVQDNYVSGELFLFPNQVQSFPGRKFMAKEVLHYTAPGGYPYTISVSTASIIGPQCVVMHVKDFTRFTVPQLDESNVFICESQFRAHNVSEAVNVIMNSHNTQPGQPEFIHRGIICKTKSWPLETHPSVVYVKREFRINRVDRKPLVERVPEHLTSMPPTTAYTQHLPVLLQSQSTQNEPVEQENVTFYEQCVLNGRVFRLGDGVILPLDPSADPSKEEPLDPSPNPALENAQMKSDQSQKSNATSSSDIDLEVDEYVKSKLLNKDGAAQKDASSADNLKPKNSMRRIERMWKDTQGVMWFSGSWYLLPCQVEHEPTKMFYRNELIVAEPSQQDSECALELNRPSRLDLAEGTFTIMIVREYTVCRPTEYEENDVYVCDNKYFPDEKMIVKLKKGLRMPVVSKKLHLDEVYYFKKPITLIKEASPFLFQEDIDMDDHVANNESSSSTQHNDSINSHLFSTDSINTEEDLNNSMGASTTMTSSGGTGASSRSKNASRNVPLQKKASGYIAFASVMRPKLKELKPDLEFGELSKEVGNRWNELSKEEKDLWDRKAEEKASMQTPRAAEPCVGYENSTPVVVYECCWEGCDFMFEDETDMFTHLIKDETTHINAALTENGLYKCCWLPCFKNKKQAKLFPNANRLGRHLRESHFKYAARYIYPPQISRHFISKGMLAHFQHNQTNQTTLQSNDPASSVPTWGQSEVIGGIIPTPQTFRSLTHDANHTWNVVHVHNPHAPPVEVTKGGNNSSGSGQSGGGNSAIPTMASKPPNSLSTSTAVTQQQMTTQMQYNQSVSAVSGGDIPFASSPASNSQSRPPFQSPMQQQANPLPPTAPPDNPAHPLLGQSTPNRSQMMPGQQLMTGQGHAPSTPIRPTFSKPLPQNSPQPPVSHPVPVPVGVAASQSMPQQSLGVVRGTMETGVAPPHPQHGAGPSHSNVAPQNQINAHIPEQLSAPVPQAMPNPYRQGSFEANVYNHMSTGPGNPAPPPNVFTADGKPLFTIPPIKRTPLTHTKIYLDYIKNLPNKHVSDLKKTLAPVGDRGHVNKQTASGVATGMLRTGTKVQNVTRALWALRDYMLKDSISLANYNKWPDVEVDLTELNEERMEEGDGREISAQEL